MNIHDTYIRGNGVMNELIYVDIILLNSKYDSL